MNSSSSIDNFGLKDLPYLIFHSFIFKNLDLDDIWTFRLVCKKFYSITKAYNISELIINNPRFCDHAHWFSTTKPFSPLDQFDYLKPDLLTNPAKNLINLKYLRIYEFNGMELKVLNKFTKLQILEIKTLDLTSYDRLQLPNLKSLSIQSMIRFGESYDLVIDTPSLHSLNLEISTYFDNIVILKNCSSVKYLRVGYWDDKILRFQNLEHLEIHGKVFYKDIIRLKNLKKLKIVIGYSNYELEQLSQFKKRNIELVVNGVRMKEININEELRNIFNGESQRLTFQLNNYNNLEDDLYFLKSFSQDELERLLTNYQPDLPAKFSNIQHLYISKKMEKANEFAQFLSGCYNLHRLNIVRSSLDQEFYNQLTIMKSLYALEIDESMNGFNLNFEFLNKLPYLREFCTDLDVILDENLNLNNFNRLKTFNFKIASNIKNQDIFITKKDRDRYLVSGFKALEFSNDRLIFLVDFLRNDQEQPMCKRIRTE